MQETLVELPAPERVTEIKLVQGDFLVAAAGFEPRTLAAAQRADVDGEVGGVILDYRPVDSRNKLDKVVASLRELGVGFSAAPSLLYDRFAPYDYPKQLEDILLRADPARVVIDISTMSKLCIMLTLDTVRRLNVNTTVIYTEAETYGPSKEDYDKARRSGRLTRPSLRWHVAVQNVIRVDPLSSVAMQGEPTAAVAFMSFNELLVQSLVDSIYPSRLFLINGQPPKLSWREEATAWIHAPLQSEWSLDDNPISTKPDAAFPGQPTRKTSTLDYRETFDVVNSLYWDTSSQYRFIIAPTGSKMQTVGCFFAKAAHPDIHIEYPIPKGFLDLYSSGVGDSWTIHLGQLGDFATALRKQERRVRLWI